MPEGGAPQAAQPRGWFFFDKDTLPDAWRSRAIEVLMVPLLPEEAERLALAAAQEPHLTPEEELLARLVAAGESRLVMSRRLDVPLRTVDRRVAALAERLGLNSSVELRAFLARRGF